jgi:hypothetical protein
VQVTVPPGPAALPVYVVVTDGETDCVPEATGVTAPMELSSVNVDALVVVHDSVEAEPLVTEDGSAESVQVGALGGGGAVVTVTVAVHVTVPPGPVAVPV